MTRRTRYLLLAGAAGLALATPVEARAASCGGKKLCNCGDKVVRNYRLPADLGPCPDDGLKVDGLVDIDGGGHTIRGSGMRGVGLRLGPEASGSVVSNLTVRGFRHGVRLVGARRVRLSGVEASHNGDPGPGEGYGIDISRAASHNTLERIKVHDNADEGVHFGTDANGNRIVGAQIYGNARENVYFLACRDNRLERSTIRATDSRHASVYIKFATGTVIENNTISGGRVQLRGGTNRTLLSNNKLVDADVMLEQQNDRRFGPGRPTDTTVRGGSISAAGACVRIDSAVGTRVEDVALHCKDGIRVGEGSRVAIRLPSTVKVSCQSGGSGCVERLPLKPRR